MWVVVTLLVDTWSFTLLGPGTLTCVHLDYDDSYFMVFIPSVFTLWFD